MKGALVGLTLMAASAAAQDWTGPAMIGDFTVTAGDHSVTFTWTNVGDDGMTGDSTLVDIWVSTIGPMDNLNWDDIGTDLLGEPAPFASGVGQTWTVSGLTVGTRYWFTIWAGDEVPNWSLASPSLSAVPYDGTAPGAVLDLAATPLGPGSVMLTWTAPGDDGALGTASCYDLRMDSSPITGATWTDAAPVGDVPVPGPCGTAQSMMVTGLRQMTSYSFAIVACDEAANRGGVSNAATTETPPGGSDSGGGCSATGAGAGLGLAVVIAALALRR